MQRYLEIIETQSKNQYMQVRFIFMLFGRLMRSLAFFFFWYFNSFGRTAVYCDVHLNGTTQVERLTCTEIREGASAD